MKKELWFKAKRYGWGWYPSSWQGWMVILVFFIIVFSSIPIIKEFSGKENKFVLIFLPFIFVVTTILIFICYKKGEKPGWRWGR